MANLLNGIEKFLSSNKGKTILNYAYSWGASVVILGALFKILHLDGGNLMLSIGMGTEAFIFLLLGFDKPQKSYKWEEVFPVLDTNKEEDRPDFSNLSANGNVPAGGVVVVGGNAATVAASASVASDHLSASQPVQPQMPNMGSVNGGVVGMPSSFIPSSLDVSEDDVKSLSDSIKALSESAKNFAKMVEMVDSFQETTQSLSTVSKTLLDSYKGISDNSEGIVNNSIDYINQMESINKKLSGLNTVYEIQLKSLSSQIDAIDKVNMSLNRIKEMYESSAGDTGRFREETERMSQQLSALNTVYSRILNAMSMNMYGSGNRF